MPSWPQGPIPGPAPFVRRPAWASGRLPGGGRTGASAEAAAFWAVNGRRATVSCELSVLDGTGAAPRVVAGSEVAVYPRSPYLTRRRLRACAAVLVPRYLREFQRQGCDVPSGEIRRSAAEGAGGSGLPTTAQLLHFLPRLALRWLGFR